VCSRVRAAITLGRYRNCYEGSHRRAVTLMEGEPRSESCSRIALADCPASISIRARNSAASSRAVAFMAELNGGREVARSRRWGNFRGSPARASARDTYAIRRVIWPAARTLERRRALDVMSRCPKSPRSRRRSRPRFSSPRARERANDGRADSEQTRNSQRCNSQR